jgi:hypothetical protein
MSEHGFGELMRRAGLNRSLLEPRPGEIRTARATAVAARLAADRRPFLTGCAKWRVDHGLDPPPPFWSGGSEAAE